MDKTIGKELDDFRDKLFELVNKTNSLNIGIAKINDHFCPVINMVVDGEKKLYLIMASLDFQRTVKIESADIGDLNGNETRE